MFKGVKKNILPDKAFDKAVIRKITIKCNLKFFSLIRFHFNYFSILYLKIEMCHGPRSVIFTQCCHSGDRYMTAGLLKCSQNLYSFLNLLIFIKKCFSGYMIFSLFLLLCSLLPACVLMYKYAIKNGLRPEVFAQVCFAYMVFLLGIPSIIISSLTSGTIPVQEWFDTHCCKRL